MKKYGIFVTWVNNSPIFCVNIKINITEGAEALLHSTDLFKYVTEYENKYFINSTTTSQEVHEQLVNKLQFFLRDLAHLRVTEKYDKMFNVGQILEDFA